MVKSWTHCEVLLRLDAQTDSVSADWLVGSEQYPPRRDTDGIPGALSEEAPPSIAALKALRDRVSESQGPSSRVADEIEQVGRKLFWILAPIEIRDDVVNAIRRRIDAGEGVRIAIRADEPALELVPWELAFSDKLDGHLALNPGLSVVRFGDASHGDPVWGDAGSLRICFVDAGRVGNPENRLSGRSRALAGIPDRWVVQEPGWKQRILWKDVQDELIGARRANVFHFTGHGSPGSDHEDVNLGFSDKDGKADPISCQRFGETLARAEIKLAVIAACYTGVDDYWAGLGASLLRLGVPAVVSMQARVEDKAADLFVGELYAELAVGRSLDEAVGAARRLVYTRAELSDWWTAVVHTRARDTLRFDPIEDPAPTESDDQRPSIRMPRTSSATPMTTESGHVIVWSPRNSPLSGGTMVMSSDGRGCLQSDDLGRVIVGLVRGRNEAHWWTRVTIPDNARALAVHVHPLSAEILLASTQTTWTCHVDPHGRLDIGREFPGGAAAAAWTGSGFTWVGDDGVIRSDDRDLPVATLGRDAELLDAAIGDSTLLIAVFGQGRLTVTRMSLDGGIDSYHQRQLRLDAQSEAVKVGRPVDGKPSTVFVSSSGELLGWSCEDLGLQDSDHNQEPPFVLDANDDSQMNTVR